MAAPSDQRPTTAVSASEPFGLRCRILDVLPASCTGKHPKAVAFYGQATPTLRDSVARCDDFLPFQRDAVGWMKTSDTG